MELFFLLSEKKTKKNIQGEKKKTKKNIQGNIQKRE